MNTRLTAPLAPTVPLAKPATRKTKPWVAIVAGVALLILGGTSFFKSETVNNILVEAGAGQVAAGIIESDPDTRSVFTTVADVIDIAISARMNDPHELVDFISNALTPYAGKVQIAPIVSAIVTQINSAYESSDSEEKYTNKLKSISRGIRAAALDYTIIEVAPVPDV